MTNYDYDMVVVGGGINGVGIAQAAAAAGHSVLLLEKNSTLVLCLVVITILVIPAMLPMKVKKNPFLELDIPLQMPTTVEPIKTKVSQT